MIKTIDLHFGGLENTIAAFLMESPKGPILIETGPGSTFPKLEEGLKEYGYKPSDVQHVFVTHIHLDHAGAAWKFANLGATIYVHPAGKRHLADPSRLMASATRIYGDKMDELWGKMEAIDPSQIYEVQDAEVFDFEDFNINAFYTPGHAKHHLAFQIGEELVTGDVGGVKIDDTSILPPCPPPDIDLAAWKNSIERMKKLDCKRLYLTHFGKHEVDVIKHLDTLWEELNVWADYIKAQLPADNLDALVPDFMEFTQGRLRTSGISQEIIDKYEKANPSWMSVYGLARYWSKKEA